MTFSRIAFRAILVIVGAVCAYYATNVAFGGLHTLGFQGSTDYFTVTDETTYALRDNHVRFYGGIFLALGLFLILAATNVQRFRGGLYLAFALVFAGGLARLTQLQPDVTFGAANLLSAIVELALMPALFLWLWRTEVGSPKVSPAVDR